MNFSAWSIRNPVAPLLAFFLLMILGWQSFNALPITRFPNIDVPLVSVSVAQPGAAPAEMETQITKEIEDAVAGITGVKNVTSTVNDGVSSTVVEFRMDVPTDKAVQDVKDAVDQIRGDLPGDVEAPIVNRIDVEGQAIMTFAVRAPEKSLAEVSWFVDDTVTRALQGRPGIGRVTRVGGADREIRIELDPVKLDSFGVTAQQVSAQIAATNTNLGSGSVEIGDGQQVIRTLGDAGTVDALREITIALPSGRFVKLGALGDVVDTYEELKSFTSLDGEQIVSFQIYRSKGASEVSVAELTNGVVDDLRAKYPEVSIDLIDDSVFYTYGNYEAAIHTLLEGALLAILVVFAFLRNWRATLISAVALPLSAVPTFWVMSQLGFSLNLVSFLALTLATGILVDDAIVEIENIARHIRMGKTPYRAAIDAADEIGLAVIATTFTIIAVFVPVSFMPGIPGQYFRQFGLTVAVAVAFSLLVARLITPMMAAYLMRSKDANVGHEGGEDGPMMRRYLQTVRFTTGRGITLRKEDSLTGTSAIRIPAHYLTVLSSIVFVFLSIWAMLSIPGNLFPPEDESRITLSVELPPGSTLDDTEATTTAMFEAVRDIEGVKSVLVVGGATPLGERDVRRASVTIILDRLDNGMLRKFSDMGQAIPVLGWILPEAPENGRVRPQSDIEAEVATKLRDIPDIRSFKLGGPGGGGSREFAYDILSSNPDDLDRAVQEIERAVASDAMLSDDGQRLLVNVATEASLPRPEVQITPKVQEAARLGVTARQIAAVVRVATIGDNSAQLGKLSVDNRLLPIRVQLNETSRDDLARIAALRIPTESGPVPLSAVADIEISEGLSVINRLGRQRVAKLGADIADGFVLGDATTKFELLINGDPANGIAPAVNLPENVTVRPSGDAEIQAELSTSFGNAMILGLLLMLFVMILLFHSVFQPLTIVFSLLLSIGGVALALIVTQNAFSMPVMIGMLMLMGIVAKNAILLIDFAIEMRARGMERITAVIEAGHKRAQPIVMTSIAMSAGMLPSALGVGEGGSFRAPMAIAVMGGIIVSTVLSLVVVPSLYLVMDDLSQLVARFFGGFLGKKDVEPPIPAPEEIAQKLEHLGAEQRALNEKLDRMTKAKPIAAE